MSEHKRLPPWHEKFQQEDGREWLIRPPRMEDSSPLQAVFPLLGPAPLRERLLPRSGNVTTEALQRLCTPDARNEFVLIAAEPQTPGDALISAIARAAVVPRTRDAEYVILIGQFITGQGVGRKLLQRVVKWGRSKKLDYLYGWIPRSNKPMLKLAQSLGFEQKPADNTPELLRVVLDLNE